MFIVASHSFRVGNLQMKLFLGKKIQMILRGKLFLHWAVGVKRTRISNNVNIERTTHFQWSNESKDEILFLLFSHSLDKKLSTSSTTSSLRTSSTTSRLLRPQ